MTQGRHKIPRTLFQKHPLSFPECLNYFKGIILKATWFQTAHTLVPPERNYDLGGVNSIFEPNDFISPLQFSQEIELTSLWKWLHALAISMHARRVIFSKLHALARGSDRQRDPPCHQENTRSPASLRSIWRRSTRSRTLVDLVVSQALLINQKELKILD